MAKIKKQYNQVPHLTQDTTICNLAKIQNKYTRCTWKVQEPYFSAMLFKIRYIKEGSITQSHFVKIDDDDGDDDDDDDDDDDHDCDDDDA